MSSLFYYFAHKMFTKQCTRVKAENGVFGVTNKIIVGSFHTPVSQKQNHILLVFICESKIV